MIEVRKMTAEVRASDDGRTLYGTCVRYNEWSNLLFDRFKEQIAPGAFDEGMNRDIYCSFDHDRNRLLGRTSANTLKLLPDKRGINVECPVPPYSWAVDLVESIRRRDLTGMSFIFDVLTDSWEMQDGLAHRTVLKADLFEVAFVYFPAYPTTEAGVRTALPVAGEQRAIEAAEQWNRYFGRKLRQRLMEAMG